MESTSGTPHLLTDVRFTVARKGYEPDEVDNFLERVSAAVAQLQDKLRQATANAESAESRANDATRAQTLLQARVDKLESDLAEARKAPQEAPAARGPEEEAAEVSKVLVLAQRTADAAVAEARATASHVVNEAEQEASRILVTARKDADEQSARQRAALTEEVTALESSRDQLSADIALLTRYVEDQRSTLAGALTRMQAVLDDPKSLRMTSPPLPARVEAPTPASAFAAAPPSVPVAGTSADGPRSDGDDAADDDELRMSVDDPATLADLGATSTPVMVFDTEETAAAEERFLGGQTDEADEAMRAFFEADFDDEKRYGR
ncbi:MAG TPA: DivIVA domain-containing protein [Acidimicrobiales bacterium]